VSGSGARIWQAKSGRSKALIDTEQNKAAGGSHRRCVSLGSGQTARGIVKLRASLRTGVIRAYLQWRSDGRTLSKPLGKVDGPTRRAKLIQGWESARSMGLVQDDVSPSDSWASSPEVRNSMRANRGRDTGPERQLRSELHARGLRYRVSVRPLPQLRRTADIVFTKAHVAIFVDGCYWHGCPEHYRPATKNREFWHTKIADNKTRDAETTRVLAEHGWTVIRCWEHEDTKSVADRVVAILSYSDNHR
jgi:DNA mismatch endonuclease (patch repair protein)